MWSDTLTRLDYDSCSVLWKLVARVDVRRMKLEASLVNVGVGKRVLEVDRIGVHAYLLEFDYTTYSRCETRTVGGTAGRVGAEVVG